MNTALRIKVATLLGYVALSTLLVLWQADELVTPAQSVYSLLTVPQ